jgi:hypothetical protein
MIRYADDFVVLVRGSKAQAEAIKKETAEFMREQMRLTLSPEKTRTTHVDDGFDFLGFRIQRRPRGRIPVAYSFPSERSFREIKRRIKELTGQSTIGLSLDQLVHAQPDPTGLDQLPPPRREQALLQLRRPLPVVAGDALAAQEARAVDLVRFGGREASKPPRVSAARRLASDPTSNASAAASATLNTAPPARWRSAGPPPSCS